MQRTLILMALFGACAALGCLSSAEPPRPAPETSATDARAATADKGETPKDKAETKDKTETKDKGEPKKEEPKKEEPKKEEPKTEAPKLLPKFEKASEADVKALAEANTDFGLALCRSLTGQSKAPGNVAFSPVGVGAALTAVAAAARGETADEFAKTLHFTGEAAKQAGAYQALRPALPEAGAGGPFFGAKLKSDGGALVVESVAPGSPAAKAGLAAGDVLEEIDGKAVKTGADLMTALDRVGGSVQVRVKAKASGKDMIYTVDLTPLAPGRKSDAEVRLAAGLWLAKGAEPEAAWVDLARGGFGVDVVKDADLGDAAEAAKRLSDWSNQVSGGKLKEPLPSDALPAKDLGSVLVCVDSFKAEWGNPFPTAATAKAPFKVSAEKTVEVPLMRRPARVRVFKDKAFTVAELPYKGNRYAMLVVLPEAVDGLAEVEKQVTPAAVTAWVGGLKEAKADVYLPRFRAESTVDLKAPLGQLKGFGDKADLAGVFGKEGRKLDAAISRAVVTATEAGTEEGAVTNVLLEKFQPEVEFKADHPFLFVVRDNATGAILFLGRVVNPGA